IVRGALIYNASDKSDTTLKVLQGRFPEFRVLVLFGLDGRAVSASDAALRDLYVAHAAAAQDADWFKAALENRISTEGIEREDPILGGQIFHFAATVLSPVDN